MPTGFYLLWQPGSAGRPQRELAQAALPPAAKQPSRNNQRRPPAARSCQRARGTQAVRDHRDKPACWRTWLQHHGRSKEPGAALAASRSTNGTFASLTGNTNTETEPRFTVLSITRNFTLSTAVCNLKTTKAGCNLLRSRIIWG